MNLLFNHSRFCFKYQLKFDLLVVTNSAIGNGSVLPIVDYRHFG